MTALPRVTINSRSARRLRQGHLWVFDSDVRDRSEAVDADLVQVVSRHRSGGTNPLGVAFFNSRSSIHLRLIDRRLVEPDRAFWRSRLQAACELRRSLKADDGHDTVCRLVYAEADGIPGLIVDRYDDVLVVQALCAGTQRLMETWVELLGEMLQPRAIVERNDSNSRKLEGLPTRSGVVAGRLDGPVEIVEGGLRLLVDPLGGQKTGCFLDQRENRIRAASYAHGRCLDVFCYQGGFGLQLARGGASDVVLVDQSQRSLEIAEAAARLNRLRVSTFAVNAFDFLREQQAAGERYQMVVLDPPAFAKNRQAVARAARGYKEINLRAMKLLVPGGVMITSSCSHHMHEQHFEQLLLEASQDTGRTVQVLERRSQSRDHPERLGFPESRYLKCFVLRVL